MARHHEGGQPPLRAQSREGRRRNRASLVALFLAKFSTLRLLAPFRKAFRCEESLNLLQLGISRAPAARARSHQHRLHYVARPKSPPGC